MFHRPTVQSVMHMWISRAPAIVISIALQMPSRVLTVPPSPHQHPVSHSQVCGNGGGTEWQSPQQAAVDPLAVICSSSRPGYNRSTLVRNSRHNHAASILGRRCVRSEASLIIREQVSGHVQVLGIDVSKQIQKPSAQGKPRHHVCCRVVGHLSHPRDTCDIRLS